MKIAIIFFVILLSSAAMADEVRLKNNDRISGEIIRLENDVLILKIPSSEENININREFIDCVISSRDLTMVLRDNEVLIGNISCPAQGEMQIESPKVGKSEVIPLNDLYQINPAIYRGFFQAAGNFLEGNTDSKALNVSTLFEVKTKRHRFTVDAKTNYGETEGEMNVNNSIGRMKYDFFTTEKQYSYAQSLTEQDSFANLNLRNTEGLGWGYQFFDTRKLRIFTEIGASFFSEDVKVGEDKRDAVGRWAAGVDFAVSLKSIKFFHRQEGFLNPGSRSWNVRSEQGVRLFLISNVFVTVEMDFKYNSKPESDKKKSDIFLMLGLTYEYAYW